MKNKEFRKNADFPVDSIRVPPLNSVVVSPNGGK